MLSVIIPCFNEEENLDTLFINATKLLNEIRGSEVVLVNNGSSDGSLKKLNQLKLDNPTVNVTICNVKENKGYGHGILEGLKIAKNDILAWTHADLQTDILDCKKALDIFMAEKEQRKLLVKGTRTKRKFAALLLSYGMALIASAKLGYWLTEINAQPKLFHKSLFEKHAANAPSDFSLDLYFYLVANKTGKVKTFPVEFLPRIAGEAKGGSGSSFTTKVKIIKRTLKYINELKKNA